MEVTSGGIAAKTKSRVSLRTDCGDMVRVRLSGEYCASDDDDGLKNGYISALYCGLSDVPGVICLSVCDNGMQL